MGEFLGTYLTCGSTEWVVPQGATTIRSIKVMGVLKAMVRCSIPCWLIFADFRCLWYPWGSILMVILTGPTLAYVYVQNARKSLLPARCCKASM